jgi:hypothetical protein
MCAAFVIDKNGMVQYSEQTPMPKGLPNFEAVKAKLVKLKKISAAVFRKA